MSTLISNHYSRFLSALIFILIFSLDSVAQSTENYWDYQHEFYQEIKISSSGKTWYRIGPFPEGTIEVMYRITVLDVNQNMIDKLSSLMSKIPMAETQALGLAGKMVSKVTGSGEIKYTIFTSQRDADNFIKNSIYKTGCYSESNAGSKFAKNLSLTSSDNCLKRSPNYLWLGFKNLNMFSSVKVVVEAVPLINRRKSQGWYDEVKEKFQSDCIVSDEIKDLSNPNDYCDCLMDKMETNYTLTEFQSLNATQLNNVMLLFINECLSETGEMRNLSESMRKDAVEYAGSGDYKKAIELIEEIIVNEDANSLDYNSLGYYLLFQKQYLKAIKYLKKGEEMDDTEILIKGNLAHAYLLNGDTEKAKEIYLKYKGQNVNNNFSWEDMVIYDFNTFEKAGLPADKFKPIRDLLKD